MITFKTTCVIQSILPSSYLHSVNLDNYGISHVPKSVTPVLSPLTRNILRPIHSTCNLE